jgi:phosphoglycerate dehydrogenase-like enzyme
MVDRIRARLPLGVTVRARDLTRPLLDEIKDADVILPSNARIDASAIDAAPRLILIQQPAVGTDGIDLDAARARQIPVCNAPGSNGQSVCEAALLLMLALARRLPATRRAFSSASIGEPVGVELCGKTLGIIGGSGQSGSRLAAAVTALGMRVVSVRSTSAPAELDDLAAASDFVSIHCPLSPRTRGLISADFFMRMRPGAFLINCARGPIVDRAAMQSALASGRLGGAGLDTFWEEPWDPSDPLFARDDVITLPHVAGSTEESFGRIAAIVADNITRRIRGEPLLHRIA